MTLSSNWIPEKLRSFESLSKSSARVTEPKNRKPFVKFFRNESVAAR